MAGDYKTMKHIFFFFCRLFVTADNLLPFTFDVLRPIFHTVKIEFHYVVDETIDFDTVGESLNLFRTLCILIALK